MPGHGSPCTPSRASVANTLMRVPASARQSLTFIQIIGRDVPEMIALIALVGFAFATAPAAFLLAARGWLAWTALAPALLFCGFVAWIPQVLQSGAVTQTCAWIPQLGIELAFRLDGLSLLFALLITGIGSGIFLYASAYLPRDFRTPRFFATLSVFMAAMLGAVLADDLISLIVFWELTSLSSFMLIGHDAGSSNARRSAQQGLLVTVGGGLAMLSGVMLLGSAAGSYRISEILQWQTSLWSQPRGYAIVLLIALGAFSKSAQAPLHMWLPNAMVAPTPVSAYLHSATMVKLGVYLLARLNPALAESPLWTPLLSAAGLLTMLTGSVLALRQTDLKRVLAYSTIVSLGTLVLLIGTRHALAPLAMASFLLVHALYKACLFMIAGIVDHEAGSREAPELGALARKMPLTAIIAVLAAASMAGLPPLLGFIGKELIYEVGLQAGSSIGLLIAVLANACMVTIAALIAIGCFFARRRAHAAPLPREPHDPPWPMWLGPLLLALLGLFCGLLPQAVQPLLAQAAAAVGSRPGADLALWHGLTPMLGLSVLTVALGLGGFALWDRLRRRLGRIAAIDRYGPDAAYDRGLHALLRLARWQTRLIQSGSLRRYMAASIAVISAGTLLVLFLNAGARLPALLPHGASVDVALPVLLIVASLAVLRAQSFAKGIVAAGTVGFGAAVVFLFAGAPDLAFTQFSVEALSIVILLALIGKMPFRIAAPRPLAQRRRDALVASLFGLMFVCMMFSVISLPFDESLSDFFRQASVPQAHGRNLVNVIIVDFRALDTLGEITVLALAAFAATAVFRTRARGTGKSPPQGQGPSEPRP